MFWTTDKLAEKVGVSARHIRRLIDRGVVEGQKVGRDWLIADEEALRFIEERKQLQQTVDAIDTSVGQTVS